MKVTVIHGTERRGSTYNICKLFLESLGEVEVFEYFLPKDGPGFCVGCNQCFEDERKCKDYKVLEPIVRAMEESEILVFTTPTYVYHATGQMKAFLDHFGYRWMVHRPSESMFKKVGVVISTAAGAGTNSAMKDILDSFRFWGVAKSYTLGVNVRAISWKTVTPKKREEIDKKVKRLSLKVLKNVDKTTPALKVKGLYYAMRFAQKKYKITEVDYNYWEEKGWFSGSRPWK